MTRILRDELQVGSCLTPSDSGWLHKAVKFDGEDVHVIEELQLFPTPQPVKFLQLVSKTVRPSL